MLEVEGNCTIYVAKTKVLGHPTADLRLCFRMQKSYFLMTRLSVTFAPAPISGLRDGSLPKPDPPGTIRSKTIFSNGTVHPGTVRSICKK